MSHVPPPSRGLKFREQEVAMLREAAEAGSIQARIRLGAAERALKRQQLVRPKVGRKAAR